MTVAKSDIDELKRLQFSRDKDGCWITEKRKPTLADFGLTDLDYKKITDSNYRKKARVRYAFCNFYNTTLNLLPGVYLWLSPFIIIALCQKWLVFGAIYAIVWVICFFSMSSFIDSVCKILELIMCKCENVDDLERKKTQYERHHQLYDIWIVYNKQVEVEQKEKENKWSEKREHFPFKDILTKAFKVISLDLNESYWKNLMPYEFECKVGMLYEKVYGYNAHVTTQSGDGGVDVVLRNETEVKYVQCKHYSSNNHLGVKELREFYGVCVADSVKGIMVCTSSLTAEAINFHKKITETIEIVDVNNLVCMSERLFPFNDITPKLSHSFCKYLEDNLFLWFQHCYVLQCCFKTEDEAKLKMQQLCQYSESDFCYKIMHLVDQESFHYYLIGLVETKYRNLYNSFKVKY